MATFRQILVLVIVIGVLDALLYPVFAQPKMACEGQDGSRGRNAQCAFSLMLYASDSDDIFPAASSEQTLRSLTYIYIKNPRVYQPGRYAERTKFNFNLAGVSVAAPPYPGTPQFSADKIIVSHARNPKEPDEYFVYYLSAKQGTLTASQLLTALEPQFDRKGVKLFPPDYLADQDPLKEIK